MTLGRTRQVLRLTGYSAVTVATLFALVELGLRVFGLDEALEPDWSAPRVEFGYPEPIDLKENYVADADLLWVFPGYRDRVAAAAGSRPSIVFMGDSTTRGGYETRLASIVAGRYPDSDFSWVTLGVAGWSSWSGLQQLRRDVLPMRPRAVSILYGWNDHWVNMGLEDKDIARFLYPERHAQWPLLYQLQLARIADRAVVSTRAHFGEPDRARVSLDDFRSNLREMVRLARDNDIIPILLTAPTSHQAGQEPAYLATRWVADLGDLVPLHRRYAQRVLEVAAAENVHVVDLFGEFNRLRPADRARRFIDDGIHLVPQGHRKVAQLIDRAFAADGLYEKIL